MKKRLAVLLLFLLSFSLTGQSQFINASGEAKKFISVTLGGFAFGVTWSDFSVPNLPSDAVVTKIIPTIISSGFYDFTFHDIQYMVPLHPSTVRAMDTPYDTGSMTGANATYTNRQFYDSNYIADVGLDIHGMPSANMTIVLDSSLLNFAITDTISASAVGFAVYYTSATPTTDTTIAPPIAVPGGQGVAWSVPENVTLIEQADEAHGIATGSPALYLGPTKPIVGTLNYPNGKGIDGYINIALSNGTIKNTCTTPWLTVPKFNVTYPIVNGQIQTPIGNSITPNECLYPTLPYNIVVTDTKKNNIYNDNWYLPKNGDFNYDVGTMSYENFGGPITVQVPKGIISNPIANQSITQPAGTSLSLNGTIIINGVTFATAAGGITFTGLLLTNPTTSQTLTQPGGTFLNLVGNININGQPFSAGVVSWNGRTGAVTPATNDYTCSQITNALCTGGGSTVYYQTVQRNASAQPQEPALNFSTDFTLSDTASTRTNVSIAAQGGVSAGTYNSANVTVNGNGIITGISAGAAIGANFVSQTDVSGSRAFGTTYHNTTGAALLATGWGITSGSSTGNIACLVGPSSPSLTVWENDATATLSSGHSAFFCPVPNGYFYTVAVGGAVNGGVGRWVESVF